MPLRTLDEFNPFRYLTPERRVARTFPSPIIEPLPRPVYSPEQQEFVAPTTSLLTPPYSYKNVPVYRYITEQIHQARPVPFPELRPVEEISAPRDRAAESLRERVEIPSYVEPQLETYTPSITMDEWKQLVGEYPREKPTNWDRAIAAISGLGAGLLGESGIKAARDVLTSRQELARREWLDKVQALASGLKLEDIIRKSIDAKNRALAQMAVSWTRSQDYAKLRDLRANIEAARIEAAKSGDMAKAQEQELRLALWLNQALASYRNHLISLGVNVARMESAEEIARLRAETEKWVARLGAETRLQLIKYIPPNLYPYLYQNALLNMPQQWFQYYVATPQGAIDIPATINNVPKNLREAFMRDLLQRAENVIYPQIKDDIEVIMPDGERVTFTNPVDVLTVETGRSAGAAVGTGATTPTVAPPPQPPRR